MSPPPESVVREFGARGQPRALAGGQGTAWLCGEIVLKPLDMSAAELTWQAAVLSAVASGEVRLAPPVRSRSGALVVDSWTAWPRLEGRHVLRWPEILDAGERLHAALRTVPRPIDLLNTRTHRWAHADRVAWGEVAPPKAAAGSRWGWLLEARRSISLPSQLIHGDLSGNVLLADGLPPAVIDLSLYWRPARYAAAIVLVDAVAWHAADPSLLDPLLDEPDGPQLLIRAAIFRLLSDSNPASEGYEVLLSRLGEHARRT